MTHPLSDRDDAAFYANQDATTQFGLMGDGPLGLEGLTLAELSALFHADQTDIASQIAGLDRDGLAPPLASASGSASDAAADDAPPRYDLAMLLALGHRLASPRAAQFRHWASLSLQQGLASDRQRTAAAAARPVPVPVVWIGLWQMSIRWLAGWWDMIHFGVLVLVMALSPSSYERRSRKALLRQIDANVWQVLPWFTVLFALFSLVLIRIVVVSAASYGLSRFALETVVRVLVLELIPMAAALFVVFGLGGVSAVGSDDLTEEEEEELAALARVRARRRASDMVSKRDVPGVIAKTFGVTTLAAVSSAVALVLAYLVVYGFSPWGWADYTRMVGRVFDLPVSLIFMIKVLLFSLAVAIIPLAAARQEPRQIPHMPLAEQTPVPQGTVRLFMVLVMIEVASLAVKYF
jgi:phospholipid/cholesterol/gamma-HCH transport system permease protein